MRGTKSLAEVALEVLPTLASWFSLSCLLSKEGIFMEVLPTGRVGLLYYKPDSESPKAALSLSQEGKQVYQEDRVHTWGAWASGKTRSRAAELEAGRSASPGRRRNEIRFQGHF